MLGSGRVRLSWKTASLESINTAPLAVHQANVAPSGLTAVLQIALAPVRGEGTKMSAVDYDCKPYVDMISSTPGQMPSSGYRISL